MRVLSLAMVFLAALGAGLLFSPAATAQYQTTACPTTQAGLSRAIVDAGGGCACPTTQAQVIQRVVVMQDQPQVVYMQAQPQVIVQSAPQVIHQHTFVQSAPVVYGGGYGQSFNQGFGQRQVFAQRSFGGGGFGRQRAFGGGGGFGGGQVLGNLLQLGGGAAGAAIGAKSGAGGAALGSVLGNLAGGLIGGR